tara:strand:- start:1626 stop:1793 length:168 start_codon:yes stop_codon:yes gene_type:complete
MDNKTIWVNTLKSISDQGIIQLFQSLSTIGTDPILLECVVAEIFQRKINIQVING